MLKECLTATLGVFVLIFSNRLKNIVDDLRYIWGNNLPAIGKLKILRRYLVMISLNYLLCDVLFSILQPIFLILLVLNPSGVNDHYDRVLFEYQAQLLLKM